MVPSSSTGIIENTLMDIALAEGPSSFHKKHGIILKEILPPSTLLYHFI